jgi:hypothetical protein
MDFKLKTMKTKTVCKQRKAESEFKVANCDMRNEFEITMKGDDILDEEALVECLMEEDE